MKLCHDYSKKNLLTLKNIWLLRAMGYCFIVIQPRIIWQRSSGFLNAPWALMGTQHQGKRANSQLGCYTLSCKSGHRFIFALKNKHLPQAPLCPAVSANIRRAVSKKTRSIISERDDNQKPWSWIQFNAFYFVISYTCCCSLEHTEGLKGLF